MDELRMAVEEVYRILEIYEVYEYQVTQYNSETGEGGIFDEYISTFLKLKEVASRYPGWVRSPEDEERNVQSFWTSERIRLQKQATRYNDAKRGLAKMCLNSMWGNSRRGTIGI